MLFEIFSRQISNTGISRAALFKFPLSDNVIIELVAP